MWKHTPGFNKRLITPQVKEPEKEPPMSTDVEEIKENQEEKQFCVEIFSKQV